MTLYVEVPHIYQANVRSVIRIVTPQISLCHHSLLKWLTFTQLVQQALIESFIYKCAVQRTVLQRPLPEFSYTCSVAPLSLIGGSTSTRKDGRSGGAAEAKGW